MHAPAEAHFVWPEPIKALKGLVHRRNVVRLARVIRPTEALLGGSS